jgi:DNA-binding transcriptional MerR regulator
MELLRGIRHLLHAEGYTIKGVQKILREQGIDHVKQYGRAVEPAVATKADQKHGKRGRPSAAVPPALAPSRPPISVRAPENAIAVGKAGASRGRVSPAQSQAIIEAAIRELEACRKTLLETVTKKETPRPVRRARAVGVFRSVDLDAGEDCYCCKLAALVIRHFMEEANHLLPYFKNP